MSQLENRKASASCPSCTQKSEIKASNNSPFLVNALKAEAENKEIPPSSNLIQTLGDFFLDLDLIAAVTKLIALPVFIAIGIAFIHFGSIAVSTEGVVLYGINIWFFCIPLLLTLVGLAKLLEEIDFGTEYYSITAVLITALSIPITDRIEGYIPQRLDKPFVALLGEYLPKDSRPHSEELVLAARKGDVDTVAKLLQEGFSPNSELMTVVQLEGQIRYLEGSALSLAIDNANWNVVELLLESEADFEVRDANGDPVMIQLIKSWYGDEYEKRYILQKIIDMGGDVNARGQFGNTALMHAIHDVKTLQLLLKAGADVDLQNELGNTAYINAGILRRDKAITALEQYAPEMVSNRNLQTIRFLNVVRSLDYQRVVKAIEQGADVNGEIAPQFDISDWRTSPIKSALSATVTDKSRIKNILSVLLANGADINAHTGPEDYYSTPLFMAVDSYGDTERVKFLLDNGAKISLYPGWDVKLLIAALNDERVELFVLLVERGASLDAAVKDMGFLSLINEHGLRDIRLLSDYEIEWYKVPSDYSEYLNIKHRRMLEESLSAE